ncbi:MAG TPA: AraC family transcriptional regulator [Propionibacteriaceae bacterium]
MPELPVADAAGRMSFTHGVLVAAGRYVHASVQVHTHDFVEVALVLDGEATHLTLAGRQPLSRGDVVFLRPGVWHGYETDRLDLFNCGFNVDLLQRELAWMQEDAVLGSLLWTAPLSRGRRGLLTTHLEGAELLDCQAHLQALEDLRNHPLDLHRGDLIAHLTLVLGHVARAVEADRDRAADPGSPTHPVVVQAVNALEADLGRSWALADLAAELHVSPSHLLRLFKASVGMPPMAYLTKRRVETAAEMLLQGDESMSAIGLAVGWPDQNYLARRFKAHFGLSGTRYRARFANTVKQLETYPRPPSSR